jgi:hypothetical protein
MPFSNIVLLGGLLTIFPLDFEDSCFFLPLFTEARRRTFLGGSRRVYPGGIMVVVGKGYLPAKKKTG